VETKKASVLLAGLALITTMVSSRPDRASAMQATSGGDAHDQVDGTFTSVFGTTFHINAISGPHGENARGSFYVERKDPDTGLVQLDFAGFVTCLSVFENIATVGGEIDRSKTELPVPGEGNGVLLFVFDAGSPGDLDDVNGIALLERPRFCPFGLAPNPQMRGNMIVFDAD
jgi:hypothetical protein